MDQLLLTYLNQLLASPFLDAVALTLSSWGLALCPALAMALLLSRQWRRAAAAMLAAQAWALAACLAFQYTILRTRPDGVRLIFPAPNFPSYPSGHAAIAFATVVVLLLVERRWWLGLPLLVMAALISLSRVYLGFHYPSDIAAGALLGAAIGAASYGLLASRERRGAAWRWLLWPQLALVALATQIAYLNLLPRWLRAWPNYDKVLHFLLFGLVVFWLQQWLAGRRFARVGGLPVAVLVPFAAAAIDEFAQRLSPVRTFDLLDLASDLAGMVVFFGLSVAVMERTGQERARPAVLSSQPPTLKP
jgi:undecaprenyl-diphosphatase